MESLGNLVRKHVTSLQLLLLAAAFVLTLGELILLGHTKGIQLVAIGSTVAGILLSLWGVAAKGKLGNLVAALFLLLSLTGLIGTFEHMEEKGEGGEARALPSLNANQGIVVNVAFTAEEEGEGGEGKSGEAGEAAGSEGRTGEGAERGNGGEKQNIPPLAPLSLSGLALFGAVTLLGRRQEL
ncbi:MAG: hypothetical protein U0175_06510 [Caldilineaceae bacterium]